jgi:Lipase (class 3)/FYVE zinc finger
MAGNHTSVKPCLQLIQSRMFECNHSGGGVETLLHHDLGPASSRRASSSPSASSISLPPPDSEAGEDCYHPAPSSWFADASGLVDGTFPEIDALGNSATHEDEDSSSATDAVEEEKEGEPVEATDFIEEEVKQDSEGRAFLERDSRPPASSECQPPKSTLIIASSQNAENEEHSIHSTAVSTVATLAVRTACPLPAPSWKELSSHVLPAAARELLSSSLQRVYHSARVSYASSRWRYRKYSDLNQTTSALGYYKVDLPVSLPELPPFSSLPWLDRQLVQEWRTLRHDDQDKRGNEGSSGPHSTRSLEPVDDVERDFNLSRTLVPVLLRRPEWQKSDHCAQCRRVFGPTRLRHHCRNCGVSYCQAHSQWEHMLPQLGYDVPERVCEVCKRRLDCQCLAERVAWRLARCRDYTNGELSPYFEIGVETLEEAALRVTQAALTMARSIPLGAQASVAVETVDVLRKYGLNGIYTVMLRQEFLAAADLLRKALGINRTAWPLSVHELSAAIFYALAQHRALRGTSPEREHLIHTYRDDDTSGRSSSPPLSGVGGGSTVHAFGGVCDPVPDEIMTSLIQYAPLGLNFIYVEKPVDMQLLAAQQGWRLLYAYLEQEVVRVDRPASALFVNEEFKVACIAVRGTSTIQDVVTDIRQVPATFPDTEPTRTDDDWTTVVRGKGVAACGMAGAASTLYREHIDPLVYFAKRGYRIRMTGHSLGGAVATLLGVLVRRDLVRECPELFGDELDETSEQAPIRVYAFGTPSCVDEHLAEDVNAFVTTVVLHDDCVPRLTPTSCRGLLKHLLHIRETWVKDHFTDDIRAITDRAKTAWAPRWRGSFTLSSSSSKLKRYCRKHILYGKQRIRQVKEKLVREECGDNAPCYGGRSVLDKIDERTEGYIVDGNESMGKSTLFEAVTDPVGTCAFSPFDDALEPRMFLEILGGEVDAGAGGLVIDGEEFFDPTERLLEDDDDSSDGSVGDAPLTPIRPDEAGAMSHVDRFQTRTQGDSALDESNLSAVDVASNVDEDSPGSVVVEEMPLPKMFVPGRIVHIYSHRGVYRAAFVPRTFRELRRITMAGNMLSDHKVR